MSVFEEVCNLSCEKWVDSFPTEVPVHKFSKRHNKAINNTFNINIGKRQKKTSTKTIKIILIAAILLALAITVLAMPISQKYIVRNFPDHSLYEAIGFFSAKKVNSLTVNYIPEGFLKEEEGTDYCLYKNNGKDFVVKKSQISSTIWFDTEEYASEIIDINGLDAVYYKSNDNHYGIIFNDGKYIFIIDGNISKEELIKIAQNVD